MRSGPISIVSGRRIVSFDITEHDERTLDVADGMWLLVCELTVRLWDDARELSRLGFQDVILDARWESEALILEIMDSPEARVVV